MDILSHPALVSLGENCLTQGILDRRNLGNHISPFAWCRSNIDYQLQILEEDFADFLNPKFLEKAIRYGVDVVINSKYSCTSNTFEESVSTGFEFTHHNVLDSEAAMASVARKVQRFRELLQSNIPIIFFYHHRAGPMVNSMTEQLDSKVHQFVSHLRKVRKAASTVVVFEQSLVHRVENRRIELEHGDGYNKFSLHTTALWQGKNPDVFWGKSDDDLFDEMIRLTLSTGITGW